MGKKRNDFTPFLPVAAPRRPRPAAAEMAAPPPLQALSTTAIKKTTSFKPHTAATPQAQKQVQKTGPLLLKLFATADSYYSYRADKSGRMSGTLKKGKTLEIKADDEIVLTLGNAGGVTANFNGKKMGPFGKSAEVVSGILFNKDNRK